MSRSTTVAIGAGLLLAVGLAGHVHAQQTAAVEDGTSIEIVDSGVPAPLGVDEPEPLPCEGQAAGPCQTGSVGCCEVGVPCDPWGCCPGGGCHGPGGCFCCRWICGTCNMPPHYAYYPSMHGYYYFRPYHHSHIPRQQQFVAGWGGDPRNPYANEIFQRVYAEYEAERAAGESPQ